MESNPFDQCYQALCNLPRPYYKVVGNQYLLQMDDQYYLLFEKIAQLYISATAFQRSNMRQKIQKNKDVRQALIWWHPKMEETHPKKYLRLCLVSISLQGGLPDFRDILLSLVGLWNQSEKKGIDPTPFYAEAVEWGGGSASLISQVMDPDRRQRIIGKS